MGYTLGRCPKWIIFSKENSHRELQFVKLKKMFIERFLCNESKIISVAELGCQGTNCPPAETIITIRPDDTSQDTWWIHKSIDQVTYADICSLAH